MITKKLIQKCLDYFAGYGAGCGNYRRASRLWEDSGHSVEAMLGHDDADEWRYHVACLVRLSRSRRWELVRDIRDAELRYRAACYVPDLSRSRRWKLVRDFGDETWRRYAADYVPGLTAKQQAELRRGNENRSRP